jgi:hypothetical protein
VCGKRHGESDTYPGRDRGGEKEYDRLDLHDGGIEEWDDVYLVEF